MEYNETNGTNWNDLPSEIHDFIFKQLDLVDDPSKYFAINFKYIYITMNV